MFYPGTSGIAALITLLTFAVLSGERCVTVADEKKAHGEEIVVEEASFQDGHHSLSGSLYRPQGAGPHPAIVMILGSDRQDRDFGGAGPILGRHFARAGFACLFWDKPGVGRSTGDFHAQSLRDRAREALVAVRFLGGRNDIRRDRIGLWGHSQGGMVAPLAASLSQEVAFLIEVSGWQGPAWKQDAVRVEAELRADRFPEADIERAVSFARLRMEMILRNRRYEELEDAQNAVKMFAWFRAVVFLARKENRLEGRRSMLETPQPSSMRITVFGKAPSSKPAPSGVPAPRIAASERWIMIIL